MKVKGRNRTILFRAKRIDNGIGEWVEGYYVYFKRMKNACIYYVHKGFPLVTNVDPETVCQYTGLTDKKGRKIFEGDILMCHENKNDLVKVVFGKLHVINAETLEKIDEAIGWHYEVIPTDEISKSEPFNLSMSFIDVDIKQLDMEVIGNIFDNPELLKKNIKNKNPNLKD